MVLNSNKYLYFQNAPFHLATPVVQAGCTPVCCPISVCVTVSLLLILIQTCSKIKDFPCLVCPLQFKGKVKLDVYAVSKNKLCFSNNRRAGNRHQCRKTSALSFHGCLIKTIVEIIKQHSNIYIEFPITRCL